MENSRGGRGRGRGRGNKRGNAQDSRPGSSKSSSQVNLSVKRSNEEQSDSSTYEKLAKLKLESKGEVEEAVGRGNVKNRKLINVSDVIRTRPDSQLSKKGDYGKPVELLTNYFKLETVPDWVLFQYRVDFNVQEDRERVRRAWLGQHRERLNTAYIFDGSMLFTSQRLTPGNEPLTLTSFREDKSPVEIVIKLVQQLQFGNAVYLQVFNILVRRCLLHLNLHMVRRDYFDPRASIQVPQYNMEVWPGYITSIRQHEKSILMCTDISHKIMRSDTALRVFEECKAQKGNYKTLFQQCILGAIVLTDYNNKTYRVDDVDFSVNPLSTFLYKNNEKMTYVEYYKMRYQINIRDLRQPLLISRNSARDLRAGTERQCLLVPELCRMTGLDEKMLSNRNLMRSLAEITGVPPGARIDRLKTFHRRLLGEKKVAEEFSRWQLKLSSELLKITGRELPAENIIAGKSVSYSAGPEVDWTRSMRSAPVLKSGRFDCFVAICPYRLKRDTESFLNTLGRLARGMDFRIPQPIVVDTRSDAPADMLEAVEMTLAKYRPDLILFAFTTERADRYSAVKKKCYVDRGIPSQVILAKNLASKGVMSIATKVAVQINSKIGGAPWTVQIPAEHVMVVGYDVCHDKTRRSKSVGAVVASLNQAMSAWYSTVSFHSNGEELSNSLALDVLKAIRKYREVNSNALPNRIFVYRDGVGEGQINYVYNHEVVLLKKYLTELYGGETWKLAYIIVTKRIKTRFFKNNQNPKPGTIVDDDVTLPERYDFYLVSQSVRLGTVSPTSYNVISDNLGWQPNHIQRFTYKMTHLYYNCSATVGVPAPCQYAHKLAFMVGQSLHAEPHPNLDTRLYFL